MHIPHKLALSALVMAILFDVLFHDAMSIGLNLLLAQIVFLGGTVLLARETKHTIPHHAWIAAAFALAYSATFSVWTSDIGLVVSLVGFFSSNFLFAAFILGQQPHFRHPLEILWRGTIDTAYKMLSRLHIVGHLKPAAIKVDQSIVIKGCIVAFPLLLIFALLFASADPIFAHYADLLLFHWMDTFQFSQFVSHTFFIGFFALLFLLFFAAAYWERFTMPPSIKQLATQFESESIIVIGSIVVLFGSFLLLQARTLLGGETVWATTGLTYAEYARQGFTQLIVVAVLVLAVILTLRVLHGVAHKTTNTLHLVLLAETTLILVSAVRRLSLYVDAYGYTPSRLFAYWMMLVVAVLMGILAVNILWKEEQYRSMQHGLLALGVLGFLFTASAPDALSASLNIQAAKAGGRPVDIQMLLNLSPEAASVIYAGFSNEIPVEGLIYPSPADYCDPADGTVPGTTYDQRIRKQIMNWYEDTRDGSDWQSWNLSRMLFDNAQNTHSVPEWITRPDQRAGTSCG